MSEMVERVALVLKNALAPHVGLSVDCGDLARSIIAAMREPTKDMLDQGAEASESALSVWEAMIDAALGKEKP